jgi:hypothetical protein
MIVTISAKRVASTSQRLNVLQQETDNYFMMLRAAYGERKGG